VQSLPVKLRGSPRRLLVGLSLVTAVSSVLMGCSTSNVATRSSNTTAAPATAMTSNRAAGYLPRTALPNSLTLLPAPPAANSAAFAADVALYRHTRALLDTPRWALAALDANLSFPTAASTFSCAIRAPISEDTTPRLYALLRRTLTDAGLATYAAKNHYQRRRPFMEFNEATCTPQDESRLRNDGSYPSGHAAIGWAWALIMTELAPEQTDTILARGYAFADSRMICGVHWHSDVNAARVVAAGVVARLHADEMFNADMRAAKQEVTVARSKQLAPNRDCNIEAAALAIKTAAPQ
jgi:acid phosphatase (class A)